MSFNNVQSLNGVIKPHRMKNINSNTSSNPNSQFDYYNQQINSIETDGYKSESINSSIDNTSLELALNVLGIEHNTFEKMSKHEFLHYYDNFKTQNSNLNRSLAAQIALKYKLNNVIDVNSGLFQNNQINFYQPESYKQQNTNKYFIQSENNNLKNQQNIFQYQVQSQMQPQIQSRVQSQVQSQMQPQMQSQVQSQENDKNSKTNKTFLQQTNNHNKKIIPINENMEVKSNYKPVQVVSSDNSKYLLTSSNVPPIIDQYSRNFDLNSIIDNYAKQKNSGATKNIDVSYNVKR